MEDRAVAVDARNRRGTVPVVRDVLRDSDPLENRGRYYIRWARQMTTDGEHSRTPIRVLNGYEQQACPCVSRIADEVFERCGVPRNRREAHEPGDLVRPASGRGVGLPGPSASHVAIAEVAGCVKGSLPGQRDLR